MRIIARHHLVDFSARNPQAMASINHWFEIAKAAKWAAASEVQSAFSKAKVLNGERVRFEISGGDFRLIVAFNFKHQIAFIKFLGTHAEYDKIDALTVSLY